MVSISLLSPHASYGAKVHVLPRGHFPTVMDFCDECGALLPAGADAGECEQCGATFGSPSTKASGSMTTGQQAGASAAADQSAGTSDTPLTELESLPTTSSGSIKKSDAMEWLNNQDRPTKSELKRAVVEKPNGFSGSTFPTDISTIRLTGDAQFIETIAGLFTWMVDMEDYSRRVEINLKKTEDKETGEETGNYALYLSVAERG